MRYKESALSPLPGIKETYHEWRTAAKIMANLIDHQLVRPKKLPFPAPWGRFPFSRVNAEVIDGNPRLRDVIRWREYASKLSESR